MPIDIALGLIWLAFLLGAAATATFLGWRGER